MRSPYLFRVYVSIPGHVYKCKYLFGDEDALLCYVEPYREQAREIAYSVILIEYYHRKRGRWKHFSTYKHMGGGDTHEADGTKSEDHFHLLAR